MANNDGQYLIDKNSNLLNPQDSAWYVQGSSVIGNIGCDGAGKAIPYLSPDIKKIFSRVFDNYGPKCNAKVDTQFAEISRQAPGISKKQLQVICELPPQVRDKLLGMMGLFYEMHEKVHVDDVNNLVNDVKNPNHNFCKDQPKGRHITLGAQLDSKSANKPFKELSPTQQRAQLQLVVSELTAYFIQYKLVDSAIGGLSEKQDRALGNTEKTALGQQATFLHDSIKEANNLMREQFLSILSKDYGQDILTNGKFDPQKFDRLRTSLGFKPMNEVFTPIKTEFTNRFALLAQ